MGGDRVVINVIACASNLVTKTTSMVDGPHHLASRASGHGVSLLLQMEKSRVNRTGANGSGQRDIADARSADGVGLLIIITINKGLLSLPQAPGVS